MKISIEKDRNTKTLDIKHDCKDGEDFSELLGMLEFAKMKLFSNNDKGKQTKKDEK